MNMMSHPVLTRGIVALRADASGDPKQIFAELQKSFEAFKAEHAAQLTDLRKGQEDVVRAEKVDRINAAVGELQAAMDTQAAQIAALDAQDTAVRGRRTPITVDRIVATAFQIEEPENPVTVFTPSLAAKRAVIMSSSAAR